MWRRNFLSFLGTVPFAGLCGIKSELAQLKKQLPDWIIAYTSKNGYCISKNSNRYFIPKMTRDSTILLEKCKEFIEQNEKYIGLECPQFVLIFDHSEYGIMALEKKHFEKFYIG